MASPPLFSGAVQLAPNLPGPTTLRVTAVAESGTLVKFKLVIAPETVPVTKLLLFVTTASGSATKVRLLFNKVAGLLKPELNPVLAVVVSKEPARVSTITRTT